MRMHYLRILIALIGVAGLGMAASSPWRNRIFLSGDVCI